MAASVARRTIRSSEPERIEADLAALWRELAREAPISRAVLSNLVVFCYRPVDASVDLAQPLELPLDEIASRHPSRIIVLHHGRREDMLQGPSEASIGVLTFGPAGSRYGVEEIAIRAVCGEASLPSIVRRLTLGGVPTTVWWTADLSAVVPLTALVTMGRQLIYDSRLWQDVRLGVRALQSVVANPDAPDLADLNWRRLTTLREALHHVIASAAGLDDRPAGQLRVRHRSGEAALAWLLAGWIEAQLAPVYEITVAIEEAPGQDDLLVVAFGQDEPEITLALTEDAVVVRLRGRSTPDVIARPRESDAEAVAAELRSLARDVCLHAALAALVRRFALR